VLITIPEVVGSYLSPTVILDPKGFINQLAQKLVGGLAIFDMDDVSPESPFYPVWKRLREHREVTYNGIRLYMSEFKEEAPTPNSHAISSEKGFSSND
jgi:hypothetical protein